MNLFKGLDKKKRRAQLDETRDRSIPELYISDASGGQRQVEGYDPQAMRDHLAELGAYTRLSAEFGRAATRPEVREALGVTALTIELDEIDRALAHA